MAPRPPANHPKPQNPRHRITLQTDYAPITRLILETADRNFQRTARIQVPALINGRPAWRTIAEELIERIQQTNPI